MFNFAEGVNEITDLQIGMKLPGIVTNVAAFGAFVDLGVHQDGLIHVSELSHEFIKDPAEVVKVGDKVEVMVMEVDVARKRISLSLKQASEKPANVKKPKKAQKQVKKDEKSGKIPENLSTKELASKLTFGG